MLFRRRPSCLPVNGDVETAKKSTGSGFLQQDSLLVARDVGEVVLRVDEIIEKEMFGKCCGF